jgi:ATPase subunit of ABC transporter with duplicated ATPase domains
MLIVQGVSYSHPNHELLFSNLNFVVNKQDKIGLIGNNGSGKSTLLKIIAGQLQPAEGIVTISRQPYYVPQVFGQINHYTVAGALGVQNKINALQEILRGNVTNGLLEILDDDWAIEERCKQAFAFWKLPDLDLSQKMDTLSGGQKTKVFLAGIIIHQPDTILLDEPGNHLDSDGKTILEDYIKSVPGTVVVVSHDRKLLNQLNKIYELSKKGITVYGGNYDFYKEMKSTEADALHGDVKTKEKAFRLAKETERASLERQQKLDARGRKKQEKAGLPTISMNTLKNNAEKSSARLKEVHAGKVDTIHNELTSLRKELPENDQMRVNFDHSKLHKKKILISAENVNAAYDDQLLWKQGISFQVTSGDRIRLTGKNGSGKTTLIKMILGELIPREGLIKRAAPKAIYIDQDYSLVDNSLSVYEQAAKFNTGNLHDHEIKIRLNRFLFTKADWDKPCIDLSGGEKMRLMLCCLTINQQAPDIIVLDEPTNNLDIQNMEILTAAINEYEGTLIVVSHDEYFLQQINIERSIDVVSD